ncbi:hypothetical protein COV11_01770 [Candidatus Woesearchaeota archaeon CG10_big_fil_rev_8_21_14_0_10_30_7]|nr:MAG: hypothetical protein COV11_01770 [Candidatus Woesearchaeota archaeon CG10_big_fil_rev_8_21_14_0_10_30_7]
MKLLTDENVATSVYNALLEENFDVKDIKAENLNGSSDKKVLDLAIKEKRIIITHDQDFANVLNQKVKHKGIILLRFRIQLPKIIINTLIHILKSKIKDKLENNVTIISEDKIKIHTNI